MSENYRIPELEEICWAECTRGFFPKMPLREETYEREKPIKDQKEKYRR